MNFSEHFHLLSAPQPHKQPPDSERRIRLDQVSSKTGSSPSQSQIHCLFFCLVSLNKLIKHDVLSVFGLSVGGVDSLKIEEMEKMLKEAQLEKARLIESRVRNYTTSI